MDINLAEIIQTLGVPVTGEIAQDEVIHEISTDTRALDKADLFFALAGKHFDGHHFIKEAIEKKW